MAEVVVAGILFVALVVYVLTGGADFGGGVWDLLATGPRAPAQRRVIARAIGPIWEANHVWLILVIVLLFVCFPSAFALVGTALHWPLTLMLVGVVLRGSAFVFRTYDSRRDSVQKRWSRVFASASVFTPVMLGISVGAVASGAIRTEGGVYTSGFFAPWLQPFPIAVGLFTLALFALLAAVYLAADTEEPELQDDFRLRALGASAVVFVLAWVTFFTAHTGAPHLRASLVGGPIALGMQGVVGLCGLALVGSLWARRFQVARILAAVQVVLLIAGWGHAQFPWILMDELTIHDAAAPQNVLVGTVGVLGAGAVPLLAAYGWMIRVFRRSRLSGAPSPESIEANPE
ncbi:MAG: cytochrome d ubiquinol oxidase subunit II [Alphaproteobacteria bacterium]|nr:cytochrome d ubiquinol oxidase subunit II [Alphaproteobacteria bacterium]